MKNENFHVQRVGRFNLLTAKGHDVIVNNRRIACVAGLGENNFSYYLFDESQEDRVLRHICSLAKQRCKIYADPLCWSENSEIWPLVA